MGLAPLPAGYADGRATLQRVATHVLARRRFALCGRIGMRATPGGFGIPASGPVGEVVRIAGARLIREVSDDEPRAVSLDLHTANLGEAADFVEVDLSAELDAGADAPAVGSTTDPLGIGPEVVEAVSTWLELGWVALDGAVGALDAADASVVQLWPEHFDAGCDVATGADRRANLGASLGDKFSDAPYLYVSPWDSERPGDAEYWNAPFGAALTYEDLRTAPDPVAAGEAFLLQGIERLRSIDHPSPAR